MSKQNNSSPSKKMKVFQIGSPDDDYKSNGMHDVNLDGDQEDHPQNKDKGKIQEAVFIGKDIGKSDDIQPKQQEAEDIKTFEIEQKLLPEYDVKTQTLFRILFAAVFLCGLILNMFKIERVDVITQEQCMRDYTFIWSDNLNIYLRDHIDVKNRYIIYASFLMDLMLFTFFSLFFLYWKTYRVAISYTLFFGIRTLIQKNFFMTRLEGFLFFYPGFHSFTVPYHDVNDFFYSGHIGTCFLVVLEYRACKWYKMSYFTVFIMLNQWLMMCLVRTHYIIDMVTGLIVSHYVFMIAERLSFFVDSKIMRISGKKRGQLYFKPCRHCGWDNLDAKDFMSSVEKAKLKQLHYEQNFLQRDINVKFEVEEDEEVKSDFEKRTTSSSKPQSEQSYKGSYAKQEDCI